MTGKFIFIELPSFRVMENDSGSLKEITVTAEELGRYISSYQYIRRQLTSWTAARVPTEMIAAVKQEPDGWGWLPAKSQPTTHVEWEMLRVIEGNSLSPVVQSILVKEKPRLDYFQPGERDCFIPNPSPEVTPVFYRGNNRNSRERKRFWTELASEFLMFEPFSIAQGVVYHLNGGMWYTIANQEAMTDEAIAEKIREVGKQPGYWIGRFLRDTQYETS